MTKKEFLTNLRRCIRELPSNEINERLSFYSEIIDDKMEEGLSEVAAVADVGSIDKIAAQILADGGVQAPTKKVKRPVSAWQIVLLIVGSPIWFSILLVVFAVTWSVIITLWAVEIPFAIIGFIAKYLGVACIESTKFMAKLTKCCAKAIGGLFGG